MRPARLDTPIVRASNALEGAIDAVSQVVRDKEDVVRLLLISYLARGHALLEDVPGVGKTTLARALAKTVGGTFRRIQLTADLLPSDILGGQVLNRESGAVEFRAGPVFANVVLADELNRATPRTQSGLLEAMAERSISVDGASHRLPDPFMVIATQNPTEHHGVYPLPESQLDRFLIRASVGYPGDSVERALILDRADASADDAVENLPESLSADQLKALAQRVPEIQLSEDVADYLHAIVRATRHAPDLETGVSTRGTLQFARAARARALSYGRDFVSPEDVKALAVAVCAHRVVVRGAHRAGRAEAEAIIQELLKGIDVPV